MEDLLSHLHGDNVVAIIAVFFGIGGAVVISGMTIWFKHRKDEINAELKQEMLAQGMSADEIVRVLDAGDSKSKALGRQSQG